MAVRCNYRACAPEPESSVHHREEQNEKTVTTEYEQRRVNIQITGVPEEENQSKRTRQILRTIIQEKLLLKRFETTYWKNLPRS